MFHMFINLEASFWIKKNNNSGINLKCTATWIMKLMSSIQNNFHFMLNMLEIGSSLKMAVDFISIYK